MATSSLQRCAWADSTDLMRDYHDREWGVPEYDSRALWEKLMLDGFQAGLSWAVILNKRAAFREAFAEFDPNKVARFDEKKITTLLQNAGIVRSRAKIEATIGGAKAYLAMQAAGEDFSDFVWGMAGGKPIVNRAATRDTVPPTQTPLSAELSKAFKARGFKFVGPVIVYAWMQATGIVNDHAIDCPRRTQVARTGKSRQSRWRRIDRAALDVAIGAVAVLIFAHMSDLHYFRKEWIQKTDASLDVDICVYGASSAGVIAAIEAVERGKAVALLQPGKFIGGLSTGGLGETDFGKQHVVGGKAREFYRRCGTFYNKPEEWHFEPHVAQAVYDAWLKSAGVTPMLCQYLDTVEMVGGKIAGVTMLGGLKVKAKIFIDATYEGDLMAKAGVPYHVGREGNAKYGETINGVQVHGTHQFVPATVDPYIKEGDPSSGLLPHIEAVDQKPREGEGDSKVQAYCFRICMTNDPALRIDWEKPQGYDPMEYVLAERWFNGEKDNYNDQLQLRDGVRQTVINKFDIFPNKTPGGFHKTDTNNHGPVSSDFIGMSWGWADGCFEAREELFQRHVAYQKGFYWFMANSPKIPERYQKCYREWGLAKDEFTTTGGWSHTLYVREARRMISDYVVTEADTTYKTKCTDPVAMGSYALDSHNCTRFINAEGKVMNDGDVQLQPKGPYGISYRSIVPAKDSVPNLFVPICCSTSHIAYGSVRMEPVFMILGESSAIAACIAIDQGIAVQDVPYATLRPKLESAKQVLAL